MVGHGDQEEGSAMGAGVWAVIAVSVATFFFIFSWISK
jgi:hypothetical protein